MLLYTPHSRCPSPPSTPLADSPIMSADPTPQLVELTLAVLSPFEGKAAINFSQSLLRVIISCTKPSIVSAHQLRLLCFLADY